MARSPHVSELPRGLVADSVTVTNGNGKVAILAYRKEHGMFRGYDVTVWLPAWQAKRLAETILERANFELETNP